MRSSPWSRARSSGGTNTEQSPEEYDLQTRTDAVKSMTTPETASRDVTRTMYRLRKNSTTAPVTLVFQNRSTSSEKVIMYSYTRNAAGMLVGQRKAIREQVGRTEGRYSETIVDDAGDQDHVSKTP